MKLFTERSVFFPPAELSGPEGLVAVDDDLSVERLLEAYSFGIFPWPEVGYPVLWFSPESRGVIDFEEFHIPERLAREIKKTKFSFSWDNDFETVMLECRNASRPGQSGTWITPVLEKAYLEFHRAGYAHSLEVWLNGDLVGGLYGVYVGGVFAGESMFFKISPASKAALIQCVSFLKAQGLKWMDIQMVTPLSKSFGAKYISRNSFLDRLADAKLQARALDFKF